MYISFLLISFMLIFANISVPLDQLVFSNMSFTDENRKELEVKGYTVVKNVLTEEECDIYINQYKVWLKSNFAPEEFPNTVHSLVQRYSIGHLEPTWHVRMKSRGVFAQVWGTERLLTSVDAVAIGERKKIDCSY